MFNYICVLKLLIASVLRLLEYFYKQNRQFHLYSQFAKTATLKHFEKEYFVVDENELDIWLKRRHCQ